MNRREFAVASVACLAGAFVGHFVGSRNAVSERDELEHAASKVVWSHIVSELRDGEWRGQPVCVGAAHEILVEDLYTRQCTALPPPYTNAFHLELNPTICEDGEPPSISARIHHAESLRLSCEAGRFRLGMMNRGRDGYVLATGGGLRVSGVWQVNGNFFEHSSEGDWYQLAELDDRSAVLWAEFMRDN